MKVSVVVLAKNEEEMIEKCLLTLKWADEVVVVDDGSTDKTAEIAKGYKARVIEGVGDFAENRNLGAKAAGGDWLLYVDADERVMPKLAKEIRQKVEKSQDSAYKVRRKNYQIGKYLKYGGWGDDWIVRLFRKKDLKFWKGRIHEHAEVEGSVGKLEEPLYHLTHRGILEGLKKSIQWTNIEAELLLSANHPRINTLRLIKVTLGELWRRIVLKKAFLDGISGMIEAFIQAMNRFIVYTRLWELQQKPTLSEKYEEIEERIRKQWKEV